MELELTEEQESELHKTVELIVKGMMLTMHKQPEEKWVIDLTGRSDWDYLCHHVAANAIEDVDGYSATPSEDGHKIVWSVDGREVRAS